MKKLSLLSALGFLFLLNSCIGGGDDSTQTMTFNVSTINIVTSRHDNITKASKGNYTVDLDVSHLTGTVSTVDFVADGTIMRFITNDQTYKSTGYNVFFENATATINDNSSYQLQNGSFLATPWFYYPQDYLGYPSFQYDMVASFEIGDLYKVRTYPTDAVYVGTTNTSYESSGTLATNQTDQIIYEVIINPTENKAKMMIYNAKFSSSPHEPTKVRIDVDNLDVVFSDGLITISGENVVPSVLDGSTTTPNESYKFNSINFTTTNPKLTSCKITYEVAGMYHGEFVGSYIVTEGESYL